MDSVKLEKVEQYIDVKYLLKTSTIAPTIIKEIDLGVRECTIDDVQGRGDDIRRFNLAKQAGLTLYCVKDINNVEIDIKFL